MKAANQDCKCSKVADHRRAALIALCRAALEVDGLREAVARERPEARAQEPDSLHEVIEELEARLDEEGRALGVFEDEYECGCDEAPVEPPSASAAYDDEATENPARDSRGPGATPARQRPKRVGLVATLFGALGVACAMASLVMRTDAPRSAE